MISGGFAGKWDEESILAAYGYSVNQQDGLTDEQRQRILSFVIDNGIMDRYECINHLEFCISIRRGKFNMRNAIDKWESDIEFLYKKEKPAYSISVDTIYRR